MKVLLTTPTYPPDFNSGLGNAVQRQAAALVKQGLDVTVATGGDSRFSRNLEDSGVRVEQFNITGARTWLNPIRGEVDSYAKYLRDSAFDIVIMHAWQNWATDIALKEADSIKARKYLFSHCISTNVFYPRQPMRSLVRYLLWRPYWWSLKKNIRKLDGIFFLSEAGDDSRFSDLDVARQTDVKIYTVANSLSFEATEILPQPFVDRTSRKYIISVGSYNWQKGFDFVLRAYAASTARNMVPIKFFGQARTPFIQELSSLADKLGIDRAFVHFNHGVSGADLMAEYRKSILFLSGSLTECQPLVLLDSIAAGTPFIARRTGCISSIEGGLAIDDLDGAVRAIDELMANFASWSELVRKGRATAEDSFHPDITTRQLLDVIVSEQSV